MVFVYVCLFVRSFPPNPWAFYVIAVLLVFLFLTIVYSVIVPLYVISLFFSLLPFFYI